MAVLAEWAAVVVPSCPRVTVHTVLFVPPTAVTVMTSPSTTIENGVAEIGKPVALFTVSEVGLTVVGLAVVLAVCAAAVVPPTPRVTVHVVPLMLVTVINSESTWIWNGVAGKLALDATVIVPVEPAVACPTATVSVVCTTSAANGVCTIAAAIGVTIVIGALIRWAAAVVPFCARVTVHTVLFTLVAVTVMISESIRMSNGVVETGNPTGLVTVNEVSPAATAAASGVTRLAGALIRWVAAVVPACPRVTVHCRLPVPPTAVTCMISEST